MKRKDEMTSNERLEAYFNGEEVDRIPAMPMIDSIGPALIGHEVRYKRLSAENQVEVKRACYELLTCSQLVATSLRGRLRRTYWRSWMPRAHSVPFALGSQRS